jgi:ribosomal protein S18 acetylase RimI-like enzyme
MGLVPAARGQGYGQAMMQQAFKLARGEAVPCLTLSVDEKNLPARRLYRQFGFTELTRRDVWVRIIGKQKMVDRGELRL